jgi:hypothetical protein
VYNATFVLNYFLTTILGATNLECTYKPTITAVKVTINVFAVSFVNRFIFLNILFD